MNNKKSYERNKGREEGEEEEEEEKKKEKKEKREKRRTKKERKRGGIEKSAEGCETGITGNSN